MRLHFHIHFHTVWGQHLAVVGGHPQLGGWNLDLATAMSHQGDGKWVLHLDLDFPGAEISYAYVLVDNNRHIRSQEFGQPRILNIGDRGDSIRIIDAWRSATHQDNALYTSPFRDVLLRSAPIKQGTSAFTHGIGEVCFKMYAPRTYPDAELIVVGSTPELGNWDISHGVVLEDAGAPLWRVALSVHTKGLVEYKYAWRHNKTGQLIAMETGSNRKVGMHEFPADRIVITDDYFAYPDNGWRAAGVAIPVFSLRSDAGYGVGEFADIPLMVDWAQQSGLKMVQILPVNDTTASYTWVDSYPYAAISVFALHPLFLRIDLIDGAETVLTADREEERLALNRLDTVDYEAVMKAKREMARALFEKQKDTFLVDPDFLAFYKDQKHWLDQYSVFCYLRDHYGTADFSLWGEHAEYTSELLSDLVSPSFYDYDHIAFSWFLQYHLDKQLREAKAYANAQGVILKGDLPIGIFRHSVDAWVEPRLYYMDAQAGAPPDPFSATGQNWGFPTYNWHEMAKDNYQWWRDRMTQLSRYFDTYRIDHILGFFRIWQIPINQVEGTLGYFNPAIPVTPDELRSRGISYQFHRFCQPYITEGQLNELFGTDTNLVKAHFMESKDQGYAFKEGLNNQRAIQKYISNMPVLEHVQAGLFQLVGNVLFIPEPGRSEDALHPRIEMMDTQSFQALDSHAQEQLRQIYWDYFYSRQETFWRSQAMEKLPALKAATDMLICGEDLGMVPTTVPEVMRELNILTLEIQRMSKNPATTFLQEADIPYLSVASPSTHDMSPIRAWWEEEEWTYIQRFYEEELHLNGDHPKSCEPYIAQAIIRQHLRWPSMWTVFPLQDLLAMDGRLRRKNPQEERINVPANPQHYWRYRMHLNLEDLLEEKPFMYLVRAMLKNGGRL